MIRHRKLGWEQRRLRGTEKSRFAVDEVPSRRAIPPLMRSPIARFTAPTVFLFSRQAGPAVPR